MITTASTIPSSTHLLPLPVIKPLPMIHNIPPPITQVIRPVSPGQIIQQQLSSRPNTVRISPSPLPPLIKSPIRPPGTIPFTRTI